MNGRRANRISSLLVAVLAGAGIAGAVGSAPATPVPRCLPTFRLASPARRREA